jgi:hypothetical protein
MATPEKTAEVDQEISLIQRRAHMTLPLAERRKRLAVQAERMAEYYEQEPEQTERLAWQGGDTEKSGSSILTLPWAQRSKRRALRWW